MAPCSLPQFQLSMPSKLLILVLFYSFYCAESKFEPYQLNGGLLAAVAGKDYCIVASDTRLTDGGYQIHSRRYLSSRIWACSGELDGGGVLCESDGALKLPTLEQETEESTLSTQNSPCWIGSAGCAADCEALKRVIRNEYKASSSWNTRLHVNHVATLLSQVLYSRRGFPYYCFCVVAGFTDTGETAAYVYDAIGSYEQVAVATAGTGRDLLQPILDRLFASDGDSNDGEMDSRAPRIQNAPIGVMPQVVETQVTCSVEKAISCLIRGFKSVAERDIGVGDSVVLCVTQRVDADSGEATCRVIQVPLKTH